MRWLALRRGIRRMVAACWIAVGAACAVTAAQGQPGAGSGDTRQVQLDALHALQRTLSGPDPQALATVRTEVNALAAAAERHRHDAPLDNIAGLVGRTGQAMGRLDQAFGPSALPADALPFLRSVDTAVVFGSAVALATLCACFAAFVFGQRSLSGKLEATLTEMEAASAHIRIAAGLSCESALSVGKLAASVSDAETQLRGWIDAAASGQDKAAALATRCARLTEALPELLGEAVAATQARGQAAMDAAARRLEGCTGEIGAAAASIWDGAQTTIGSLPANIGIAVAELQARALAAIDTAADRLEGSAAGQQASATALRNAVTDAAASVMHLAAGQEAAATLVRRCDELTSTLPRTIDEAMDVIELRARTSAEFIDGRSQDSALCLEAAAADLHNGLRAAAEVTAGHIAALNAAVGQATGFVSLLPEVTANLATGAAAFRRETQHGAGRLAEGEARMAQATADVSASAAGAAGIVQLHQSMAAQMTETAAAAAALDARGQALCEALGEHMRVALAILSRLEAADRPHQAMAHQATGIQADATAQAILSDVQAAAARLAGKTSVHEQAAARVARAALEVAAAASRQSASLQTPLARLSDLAGHTASLLAEASAMAKMATTGGAADLPADIVATTPALLAAIETSIRRLRGTATALASASDAARLAA